MSRRSNLSLVSSTVALVTTLIAAPATPAGAALTKTLVSGPDPVGISKATATQFVFTITLDAPFDPGATVNDVLPAEFDTVSLAATCGTATSTGKVSNSPKPRPLAPDSISWDLDGGAACTGDTTATLTVTAATARNPGLRKQKPRTVYEPTSCGPLELNQGAELRASGATLFASNALAVATCRSQADATGCVDADGDGWSVSCGDCDDADAAIHPGAVEVCDGRDNDCNGQVDDGPAEGQTGCSDGNACTRRDVCRSGACVGEDEVTCPTPDACHFAGSCDPGTGTCSNPRKPDGTSCQISNACSFGADVCEFGVCVPAGDENCATPLGAVPAPRLASPGSRRAHADRARAGALRPAAAELEERRLETARRTAELRRDAARGAKRSRAVAALPTDEENAVFDRFLGFWLLDTIDDWNHATALEFHRTEGGDLRVRLYEGTQNDLREVNDNDWSFIFNPVSWLGDDIAVSVIGPRALRFHNWNWPTQELSSEELTSTARIQDGDDDVLYAQFWTPWDGSADDARYGTLENLMRYRRLAQPPAIQRNDQPSVVDWSDPVEVFRYVHDYYALLGQPQKVEALNQVDWIGAAGYEALYQQFLTSGVTRTATTTTAQRGGVHLGVWRTQFPADYPFTTIHTTAPHRFTPGSALTISGFLPPYDVLNGVHHVPVFPPSTWVGSTPEPWQADSTRQPYVLVDVDTSAIAEPYDPALHGVGELETTHGPVDSTTEYRELMASVADFVISAFGPGTHTRVRVWARWDYQMPETFDELRQRLETDDLAGLYTIRMRDYASNNGATLYWNPWWVGGSGIDPEFNLNDPFGLYFAAWDPQFDRDIDLDNYLDPASVRNVFFTVTGPTLDEEPVTSLLVDWWGYPSNGSEVVFEAGPFATPPPSLVDAWGTHDFVPYGAADWASAGYRYHFGLVGGLVKEELACGRKVAYIRNGDEGAFDDPLGVLSSRSLTFGRADMSSKIESNWTAAMAALLEELETQKPERYIFDIRGNDGGYAHVGDALAALFGGNRPGQTAFTSIVEAGLDPAATLLDGSGIQTGFDSLAANLSGGALIDTDEAAAAFPNAVVRGDANRRVEVIVLTNSDAASAGDMFPHAFLGPDPDSRVHDLGHNVFARIVGDIDGRLWSGVKGNDGIGLDPVAPDLLTSSGAPRTPLYLVAEAGMLGEDRHGTLVNAQTWTQPDVLLRGWYDHTSWQDLGLTPPAASYPLGVCTRPLPEFGDPSTWRDVWLEHAIVN